MIKTFLCTSSGFLQKVNFRLGFDEDQVWSFFSRAPCHLVISQEPRQVSHKTMSLWQSWIIPLNRSLGWTIDFGEGAFRVKKCMRMLEEFDLSMPITGDLIKVVFDQFVRPFSPCLVFISTGFHDLLQKGQVTQPETQLFITWRGWPFLHHGLQGPRYREDDVLQME